MATQQLVSLMSGIILLISVVILGVALWTIASAQTISITNSIGGANNSTLLSVQNKANTMVNTSMDLTQLVILAAFFALALAYFGGMFLGRAQKM